MDIIFERKSVRKYQNKPVEKEKVEKLLRAAMQAPSAGNQQPWEFLVIQDKTTLKKLSEMSQYSRMLDGAGLAVVLLGNTERIRMMGYWEQDMGAATENLLLEAVELGLGAVWLGVSPMQDRMNYISNLFDLPENIKPFSIVSVGYPAEDRGFTDRYDEKRVHFEKY
ncbi:MAG: nitroreductase family protein [Pseudomonadota bacterium]